MTTPTEAPEHGIPPTQDAFERIAHRTVAGDAIEQIKRLIASGVLLPQQKLPSERALAELLGVSRPTMREAMSALEAMGFVVSRHGSGTYVTSLSAEVLAGPLTFVLDVNHTALDDLFEVRALLEIGAAQAAALAVNEATISTLDQHLDAMRSATNAGELLDPDLAFHRLIHEVSGNVVLLALMTSLRVLTRQSLIASADSTYARQDAVVEHAAVLEALRRRDPTAASTAMRMHIENARRRAAAAAFDEASARPKEDFAG